MLTRLRVSGFKNMVDVDVRFGPFTCVAGANGTGKSNLFDAIHFLSLLADRTLLDAAMSIRSEEGKASDVRNLFHRVEERYDDEMSFEAEMIVPKEGLDDLGQPATATITFLRYELILALRQQEDGASPDALEIQKEELTHLKLTQASKNLLFPHSTEWRRSVIKGRRGSPFISTDGEGDQRVVKLHEDKGTGGRASKRSASKLPRTVLSAVNAAESPTATLARREMQSWRLLQLEPSALRKPSNFNAPTSLGPDGANLAATLYRLARSNGGNSGSQPPSHDGDPAILAKVANRLSELIDDVWKVSIDRDEKRELLTLFVTEKGGTSLPAMALSDGTLRFLALAVLELDPKSTGVICLEEPENGIHPERIPAMLELLTSIATDPDQPVGSDNPLRQVIINTHSPVVVTQVDDHSLIVADLEEMVQPGRRFKRVRFCGLSDTWRAKESQAACPKGQLLAYLNPVALANHSQEACPTHGPEGSGKSAKRKRQRVVDRPDLEPYLSFPEDQRG